MWFQNDKRSEWHKAKFYHDQYAICNTTHKRMGHLRSDDPPAGERCQVCQGMLAKKKA